MIKTIRIEHDSSPVSHLEDVENILKSFGVTYNLHEYDGGVKVTYDPDYQPVEKQYEQMEKTLKILSKGVVQYAKALFVLQPQIPEGFNSGRIVGPKTSWTFEECVNEALYVTCEQPIG